MQADGGQTPRRRGRRGADGPARCGRRPVRSAQRAVRLAASQCPPLVPAPFASASPKPRPELTTREREVLALLATGHAMKVIAHRLGITYRTVAFHKYKMMQRLGIRTNAGLTTYALRIGRARRRRRPMGRAPRPGAAGHRGVTPPRQPPQAAVVSENRQRRCEKAWPPTPIRRIPNRLRVWLVVRIGP